MHDIYMLICAEDMHFFDPETSGFPSPGLHQLYYVWKREQIHSHGTKSKGVVVDLGPVFFTKDSAAGLFFVLTFCVL